MDLTNSYLKKRALLNPWFLNPKPKKKFNQAVIIPAFNESKYLPNTLISLNNNDPNLLNDTLVVVIVNSVNNTPKKILADNYKTLEFIKKSKFNFKLSVVDATTPGLQLPDKYGGVGLSRKIGMDLSLPYLNNEKSLLFTTDADTLLNPRYLQFVINQFNKKAIKAAIVNFKHLKSTNDQIEKAIRQYEKFLFMTAKMISSTGSPYGYVSMGSTMICTVDAYCAVGGMPKKKATEDFYFLQELTKYCGVYKINKILVHPSPRSTERVYLGTGFRLNQLINGLSIKKLYFSKQAYDTLEAWLLLGYSSWKKQLDELLNQTKNIQYELSSFLINEKIAKVWNNIQNSSPTKTHFIKHFNCWFDALKTMKLLKYFS
tara:strand:+ start:8348 stop:9466 length:1119 start_codon:yes stop_codon:yes gene_type:complete